MSNDTKDRILKAALEIFSRDGYAGANLKDIAEAVGVVKSGFYRHYAGKEELWNAVLDEMERYYSERFGSPETLPAIPQSTDELKKLTLRMLDFTIHDEKIIMTRRILLTEQFRDARVRALATKHFYTGL
ncbi:MAG: TetR/AcrR family transcriptional regulator, partial [Lachnospiraceae bacterium]|nr:TetR/AcrR family transcriptional regulator [Candidatus Hippenecus merdae]